MHLPRTLLLTAVLALALPAAASADSVVAPATGATNLASGGGYLAWLEPGPTAGRRLVVRAPDGTIWRPDIPAFASPPQLSIGSAGGVSPDDRRLSVVFSRDGDIHRYDLRTRQESEVGPISSRYRETAAITQYGAFVFVRASGRRPGIYFWRPGRAARRVSSDVPTLVASNGTRVAYAVGRRVMLRRLSGDGARVTFTSPASIRSITLTRYRVSWLAGGGRVFQSDRFGGSGQRNTTVATQATRQLPETAQSIATDGSRVTHYVDGPGVMQISPPLFPS